MHIFPRCNYSNFLLTLLPENDKNLDLQIMNHSLTMNRINNQSRRLAFLFAILFHLPALTIMAQDDMLTFSAEDCPASSVQDARLRGYIEAWLQFAHGLGPDQVKTEVTDGQVTLSGEVDTPEQAERILEAIATFDGVITVINKLQLTEAPADLEDKPSEAERAATAVVPANRWKTWFEWLKPPPGRKTVLFPSGDLFAPPLADQKQPRFHTTWQKYRTHFGHFDIISVGFGENFGITRGPGRREGDGWQLSVSGAVFAIFNLDGPSFDLLNADYIVGFPLSFRRGNISTRFRFYHQSSHLGDEFLLDPSPPGPPVERINLSFETIELLGSWEHKGYRVYGGGSYIVRIEPTELGKKRLQAGLEYRGQRRIWKAGRFLAGLDVQAWNETNWDRDWSAKAGLRFKSPYGEVRSVQLLLEYYEGHAPHGQFFPLEVDYFGLSLAFAF